MLTSANVAARAAEDNPLTVEPVDAPDLAVLARGAYLQATEDLIAAIGPRKARWFMSEVFVTALGDGFMIYQMEVEGRTQRQFGPPLSAAPASVSRSRSCAETLTVQR